MQRGGRLHHVAWMRTRGAGGVWRWGAAKGQTRSPRVSPPCCRHRICRCCYCGPILLLLLQSLSACPVPSHHHCYRLIDCRIIHAADATSSVSCSSSSLLRPHFCAHSPSPPCQSLLLRRLPHRRPPLPGTGGKNIHRGIIMFWYLRRIVCVDDLAYSRTWSYSS